MTLKDLSSVIEDLIDEYGEECPVESFVRTGNISKTPSIWYDDERDAVMIH